MWISKGRLIVRRNIPRKSRVCLSQSRNRSKRGSREAMKTWSRRWSKQTRLNKRPRRRVISSQRSQSSSEIMLWSCLDQLFLRQIHTINLALKPYLIKSLRISSKSLILMINSTKSWQKIQRICKVPSLISSMKKSKRCSSR